MNLTVNNHGSALSIGIKTAGIGKKGSKPLSLELSKQILEELKNDPAPTAAKGAFFGALWIKGLTDEESILKDAFPAGTLDSPEKLIGNLCSDAPDFVQKICVYLLEKRTLSKGTAYDLGNFLFSNEKGDFARGLIASVLRVRYETPEEYEGLLSSMQETINPAFKDPVTASKPIIQIAEPFDGVDQSHMTTPLIAHYLQSQGYISVNMVGRNSGPKAGINLLDIAEQLKGGFLKKNADINSPSPELGWYLHQADLSDPIDRWVDIRREIIKRPFLATLERFINPLKANILIASAFHPPYGEKMLTIAERNGFPGIIIVRNGIEGSIAFALKRAVKILCSVKLISGEYQRYEFEFDPVQYLKEEPAVEENLSATDKIANAKLITDYLKSGKTDNKLFDDRVKVTRAGLSQALEWIKKYS